MSVTISAPRSTKRPIYEYMHRVARCSARALMEGGFDDRFADTIIYGTGYYTPEQQKKDAERTAELMRGFYHSKKMSAKETLETFGENKK